MSISRFVLITFCVLLVVDAGDVFERLRFRFNHVKPYSFDGSYPRPMAPPSPVIGEDRLQQLLNKYMSWKTKRPNTYNW